MTNPRGNPRIAEYGRQTRFGMANACNQQLAQERAATAHSLRHALRVAIGKPVIDLNNPTLSNEQILSLFGYRKGDKLSPVQVIAARLIVDAVNGDLNAARRIEYMLDGKP